MEAAITIWLDDPRIEKEGDFYVAYSDQLKLIGCGLTENDADRELADTIKISLKALLTEGTLFETLDKLGIRHETVLPQRIDSKHSRKPLLLEPVG